MSGDVFQVVVFAVFAVAAVAGALVLVMARNPVHSALGLLTTMFSMAVFYVMNGAHFVAIVQVIIYAGAVMTLFLFVIMLIGVVHTGEPDERPRLQWIGGAVAGAALFGFVVVAARHAWVTARNLPIDASGIANGTIENVSGELFGTWMLAFESTVLLLTIAAVGTIALGQFVYRTRAGEEVAPQAAVREFVDQSRYTLRTGTGTGGEDA